jgi:ribA/ribD-fused uncharacterized protein
MPSSQRVIAFTKARLPYGELGNMASYEVKHDGKSYRTTEALFQALRFDEETIREAIRCEKSPIAAKVLAKKHRDRRVIVLHSDQDVANMMIVLRLKLDTHSSVQKVLAETGEAWIVEDCSKRARGSGLFWGAALIDGEWKGRNMLGRLWMELRAERHLMTV